MKARGSIRPSKPISGIAALVGAIFVFIGLFVVIPQAGLFGVLWTALAVVGTVYHCRNAFSDRPIAFEEVELDVSERSGEESALTVERRLRRLENLRAQNLISAEEYEKKRNDILQEL